MSVQEGGSLFLLTRNIKFHEINSVSTSQKTWISRHEVPLWKT